MRYLAALSGVLLFFAARSAAALAPIVVLVTPPSPDEVVTEALTRIQGELVAAGCEVVPIEARDQPTTPSARVELAAIALDAVAAFEIVHDAEHSNPVIWIADRLSGKPVVRRIEVPPESGPRATSTIAVHAVELLRASLLERLVNAAAPHEAKPEKPRPIEIFVPSLPRVPRVALEVGPAFAAGAVGRRPEWLGVARVSYRLTSTFTARLAFVGVGPGTRLSAPSGSAAMKQAFGLFELTAGRTWGAVRPYAAVGVGAHHLDVQGSAAIGYLGYDESLWSGLGSVGGGVSLRHDRFFASLEAAAFFVVPSPVIRMGDGESARLGRPSVASSLTLGAWL
ncbi:MAG TPA: hypothetical protein VJT73_06690 [Polyangiaceae bacterium]|nr:hypothetical protein [Polyangiaceae bacterium]